MEKEWLELLERIHANGTTERTTTSIKVINKKSWEPAIPIDKLFELYGNLVLAGFSEDEALVIVSAILIHGNAQ